MKKKIKNNESIISIIIEKYIYPKYFGVEEEDFKWKNQREHIIRNLFSYERIYELSGRGGLKTTDYSKVCIFYVWIYYELNVLVLRSQSGITMARSTMNELSKAVDDFIKIISLAISEIYNLDYNKVFESESKKWKINNVKGNYRILYFRYVNNKKYFQAIDLAGLDGNRKKLEGGTSTIKGYKPRFGYYGIMLIDEIQQILDIEKINQAQYSLRANKNQPIVRLYLGNTDSYDHYVVDIFEKENMFDREKLSKGIASEKIIQFKNNNLGNSKWLLRVSNVFCYRKIIEKFAPNLLKEALQANKPDNQYVFEKDWLGIPRPILEDLYPFLTDKIKLEIDILKYQILDITIGIDIGTQNSSYAVSFKLWFSSFCYTPFILYYDNKNKIYFNSAEEIYEFRTYYSDDFIRITNNFLNKIYEIYPILRMHEKPKFFIDDNTEGWINNFKSGLYMSSFIDSDAINVFKAVKNKIKSRITIHNSAMRWNIMLYHPRVHPLFTQMKKIRMNLNNERLDGNDDILNAEEYSWTCKISTLQNYISKQRKDFIQQ